MVRYMAALAAGTLLTACVQAQDGATTTFDGLAGSRTVNTDGNVSMNGAAVTLEGRIGGWVEMNGASVDVDAQIGGHLEANGASVEIRGQVGGHSEINGGHVELNGIFTGPIELNAANAELRGRFASRLEANAASIELLGDHAAYVTVSGQGRERSFLGRKREDRSRIVIGGHLAEGGALCAHEVRFNRGASVGGALRIVADERPDLPEGLNASLVSYEPRNGERCPNS